MKNVLLLIALIVVSAFVVGCDENDYYYTTNEAPEQVGEKVETADSEDKEGSEVAIEGVYHFADGS